jgi:hypothetical protein
MVLAWMKRGSYSKTRALAARTSEGAAGRQIDQPAVAAPEDDRTHVGVAEAGRVIADGWLVGLKYRRGHTRSVAWLMAVEAGVDQERQLSGPGQHLDNGHRHGRRGNDTASTEHIFSAAKYQSSMNRRCSSHPRRR